MPEDFEEPEPLPAIPGDSDALLPSLPEIVQPGSVAGDQAIPEPVFPSAAPIEESPFAGFGSEPGGPPTFWPVGAVAGLPGYPANRSRRDPSPPTMGVGLALLWTLAYVILAYVPFVFVLIAFVLAVRGAPGDLRSASGVIGCSAGMGPLLGIFLSYYLLNRYVGPHWHQRIGHRKPDAGYVLLALLLLPGVMMLADWVAQHLTPAKRDFQNEQALLEMFQHNPLMWIVSIGFLTGYSEELWFRGVLGGVLVERLGKVRGVILTSFLFALVHLQLSQFVSLMGMGIVLHLVYLSTRSLWVPVTMHIANNSIAVLAGGMQIPSSLVFPAVVWVVLVGLAFAACQTEIVAKDGSARRWTGDRRGTEVPQSYEEFEARVPRLWLGLSLLALFGVLATMTSILWSNSR